MTEDRDPLAAFIESRAVLYQNDRTYRQQLARESAKTVKETLKQLRERKAA